MKFVDEASLYVKAGDGGRGCVSFRREKYIPRGGPDGGDGGKGGDVIIVGKESLVSLLDFKYKRHYKAENGRIGGGRNKTGRNGSDLYVYVPLGTIVHDESSGEVFADIVEDGQSIVIAHGGAGGQGNARFVTSVHRAPREYTEGGKGEERYLKLELKLLAEIGIVGLPNSGKSTLLSRLTNAKPEVGPYPFTTLSPGLGVFSDSEERVVIADIPGIIKGASEGKGLGLTFLKHVQRTNILLWVIDASSPSVSDDYLVLRNELEMHDRQMLRKQRIFVLNKVDLLSGPDRAAKETALKEHHDGEVVSVSALSGEGIDELKSKIGTREKKRVA
ncbi:MAG TPA: GTPase ObgE [Syntrophorhabdales bacterium]|nr:GTPase ObgE [Syntrophorhabdales bacterium]